MSYTTFTEYQGASASEKTGLCILEGAKRLVGWAVYSGSIYSIAFDDSLIVTSLEDDGTALTLAASAAACTAGKYYYDNTTNTLYARLSDSSNPDDSFMVIVFQHFFSTNGVKAPYDLATGIDVYWLPILESLSNFKLEVDNKDTQLGLAIEGTGTIKFVNDQSFWQSRYDKIFFENQLIKVYAWERTLPITEAQILFRGRVQNKSYTTESVTIQAKDVLNELRESFQLSAVGDFSYTHSYFSASVDARVDDSQAEARQRLIYGRANGVLAMNVDQVLPDTEERRTSMETGYPLTNNSVTASLTNGSKTVTISTASAHEGQFGNGDQFLFASDPDKLYSFSISTTTTTFLLTEDFEGPTGSGVAFRIFPERQRNLQNRHFLVSGHPLSEVSTTVSNDVSGSKFYITDATGISVGDVIGVTVSGTEYFRTIEALTGSNLVTVSTVISPPPTVGDAVVRHGVQRVYMDHQLLIHGDDYTVNSTTGMVILNNHDPNTSNGIANPEFNHTPWKRYSGKISFTNASKNVAALAHSGGETTAFTKEFRPGDYIRQPNGEWRRIWFVVSDEVMVLAVNANQTASEENGYYKNVEYFQEGTNHIICDVIGRTANNTTTGTMLVTAPDIVYDILVDQGVTDIDSTSFDTAADEVPYPVSLVVPSDVNDKNSGIIRDAISKLNRSVFGTLYQNSDLDLSYSIISADKVDLTSFTRSDVIDFSILSDGSKLIKSAIVKYDAREMDYVTLTKRDLQVTHTSDIGQYILKITREFIVQTNLVNEADAQAMASRWAFLLELVTSKLTAQIKMQGATISVSDPLSVEHEKLYERFGSGAIKRRLGTTSMISRGVTKSTFTIDDLANAFSRVCNITEASASDYTSASDDEKAISGYITAANGLVNSESDTLGLNLIW